MEKSEKNGRLIIVSAPSGTGKTTLCERIMARFPALKYSISHTTRAPRKGERDGVDYFFVSEETFTTMIDNNEMLEWARVHGNYYGTSLTFINEMTGQGLDILLDIDVQGARQVMAIRPDALSVFIMPPSIEVLRQRLKNRNTDSQEVIDKRIQNAHEEIRARDIYRFVIVNDDLETAVQDLYDIIANN